MFVYNDCRNDARVLREAKTLVDAGYDVTIMARPTVTSSKEVERERRDGFEIVRIPIPRRSATRTWVWVRQTWRTKGWIFRWVTFRVKRAIVHPRPRTWWQALIAVLFGLLMIPWAILQRLTFVVLQLFHRDRLPGTATLDWLWRWRQTILGWANACVRGAIRPSALGDCVAAVRDNGHPSRPYLLPRPAAVRDVRRAVHRHVADALVHHLGGAVRLTAWEANYRGIRLPIHVVRRGMYYHARHYLPVGIARDDRGRIRDRAAVQPRGRADDHDLPVHALRRRHHRRGCNLFHTYWIGMRNMMYANR